MDDKATDTLLGDLAARYHAPSPDEQEGKP